MATEHNPAGSRRRLGEALRRRRNQCGVTLEQLGAMVGVDRTQLGRVERGNWRPDVALVMKILDQLGVPQPDYDAIVVLARAAAEKGWWKSFRGPAYERHRRLAERESGTKRIREFSTVFVPGLLQTADYGRIRFSDFPSFAEPSAVERPVKARLARQSALLDDPSFRYEVVLDEAVLLRRSCPGDMLRRQLDHLAEVTTSLHNVTLRVLPLTSSVHEEVSWSTGFSLLSYRDPQESDVVFVETLTFDTVVDDPKDVSWYERVYEQLLRGSMDPDDSVRLIRESSRKIDW